MFISPENFSHKSNFSARINISFLFLFFSSYTILCVCVKRQSLTFLDFCTFSLLRPEPTFVVPCQKQTTLPVRPSYPLSKTKYLNSILLAPPKLPFIHPIPRFILSTHFPPPLMFFY